MRRHLLLPALLSPAPAFAFCGFYVSHADADLFNDSSHVVLARDGDHTTVTMANDYHGAPEEFAMVVPVPTVVKQKDISVLESKILADLDAYSAPRLAEYHDPDPCAPVVLYEIAEADMAGAVSMRAPRGMVEREEKYKVRIEAQYDIEEYNVLILSAEEGEGLQRWLRDNGYKLPAGADRILSSYIRQDMRFFVAKVDLREQQRRGLNMLRPLQVRYESDKFMLPIRLGTLNARGKQDLILHTFSRKGRVELANYRTVPMPSNLNVPTFVGDSFGEVYKAMFAEQYERYPTAGFTEYAWPLRQKCDPCVGEPLKQDLMVKLGAPWGPTEGGMLTRLHVRYDAASFPEDLRLHETADMRPHQVRLVLQHPFEGPMTCDAAPAYKSAVRERREEEARTLARLTGWSLDLIRRRLKPLGW